MVTREQVIVALFWLHCLACQRYASAVITSESGEAPGYWQDHSIVIAQIVDVSEKRAGFTSLRLRVLGTVAGVYDCSKSAEVEARVFVSLDVSAVQAPPTKGSFVLAVIHEKLPDENDKPGYVIPELFLQYIQPTQCGLTELDGLLDKKIDETRTAAQKVRKKSETNEAGKPPITWPDDSTSGYWQSHSLIVAQVKALERNETQNVSPTLTLLPESRIAGFLDPDDTREIAVSVPVGLFAPDAKLPGPHATVLVLIARSGSGYSISTELSKLLPGDRSPLCKIEGTTGKRIVTPVPLVGSGGYWATHALIYAKVNSIANAKQSSGSREISIEPQLSIAGKFDAALHPTLTIVADSKLFAEESPPSNGIFALFLLVRKENMFSVESIPAEFMPSAGHRPICPVWNLADIRIVDALNAIRGARRRETARQSEIGSRK